MSGGDPLALLAAYVQETKKVFLKPRQCEQLLDSTKSAIRWLIQDRDQANTNFRLLKEEHAEATRKLVETRRAVYTATKELEDILVQDFNNTSKLDHITQRLREAIQP